MNEGARWRCPACGDEFEGPRPEGGLCEQCDAPVRDAPGDEAPLESLATAWKSDGGVATALTRITAVALAVGTWLLAVHEALARAPNVTWLGIMVWCASPFYLGGLPVLLLSGMRRTGIEAWLRRRIRGRRITRIVRARLAELRRTALVRMEDAPEGHVRVRGTVQSIGDGDVREARAWPGEVPRLTISDGSAAAVVEGDAIELWAEGQTELADGVTLRVGDEVEIVGSATRRHVGDEGGYRGGADAVLFDGTPGHEIHLVALPRAPGPVRARVETSTAESAAIAPSGRAEAAAEPVQATADTRRRRSR